MSPAQDLCRQHQLSLARLTLSMSLMSDPATGEPVEDGILLPGCSIDDARGNQQTGIISLRLVPYHPRAPQPKSGPSPQALLVLCFHRQLTA